MSLSILIRDLFKLLIEGSNIRVSEYITIKKLENAKLNDHVKIKLFLKKILNEDDRLCKESIHVHERIVHYMQTNILIEDSSSVTAGINAFLKNIGKKDNISEERVIQFMNEITNFKRCLSHLADFYV